MRNDLYPIFLRLDKLRLLVVGAGEVGDEKLRFLLKSSPRATVTIVAPWMGEELQHLLNHFTWEGDHWQIYRSDWERAYGLAPTAAETATNKQAGIDETPSPSSFQAPISSPTRQIVDSFLPQGAGARASSLRKGEEALGSVRYIPRAFEPADVQIADVVLAATNFSAVNQTVYAAAKAAGKLINVADTPDLCDFYLGSVVTRGALKVAISTNGQSPTFAKRFRQWLEAELPQGATEEVLEQLKIFRDELQGDFRAKVIALNELTKGLVNEYKSK